MMDRKQTITITYDGKQDDEIDARIAGVLEWEPLNFTWSGQGYNAKTNVRDLTFKRVIKE